MKPEFAGGWWRRGRRPVVVDGVRAGARMHLESSAAKPRVIQAERRGGGRVVMEDVDPAQAGLDAGGAHRRRAGDGLHGTRFHWWSRLDGREWNDGVEWSWSEEGESCVVE